MGPYSLSVKKITKCMYMHVCIHMCVCSFPLPLSVNSYCSLFVPKLGEHGILSFVQLLVSDRDEQDGEKLNDALIMSSQKLVWTEGRLTQDFLIRDSWTTEIVNRCKWTQLTTSQGDWQRDLLKASLVHDTIHIFYELVFKGIEETLNKYRLDVSRLAYLSHLDQRRY